MKRLMDRLIARQGQLMSNLTQMPDTPRRVDVAVPGIAPRHPEELAREHAAIDAATHALSVGDIHTAATVLQPFAAAAGEVQTLTTLSRIRSAQGDFDTAAALLKQADRLDPSDLKVAHFTAELLQMQGRFQESIHYRRRVALANKVPHAQPLLELVLAIVRGGTTVKGASTNEIHMALTRLKQAPDVTAAHLTAAARAMYGVPSLVDLAKTLYTEAAPCPRDHQDFQVTWKKAFEWCAETQATEYSIADAGKPGLRPRVAAVKNALIMANFQFVPVVSEQTVALDGVAVSEITMPHVQEGPLLMRNELSAYLRVPVRRTRVENACILLGGTASYDDDLIDHVGTLVTMEQLQLLEHRALLISEKSTRRTLDLLGMLGFADSRLIRVREGDAVECADVLVPSKRSVIASWIDPSIPRWCRLKLCASSTLATKDLYLSRHDRSRRRLANEEQVEQAVKDLGFEIIHPERLSASERVGLLSQARRVVGAVGSGIVDMVFAPPGAHIISLSSPLVLKAEMAMRVAVLAKACGHRHTPLTCAPVFLTTGGRLLDADITVDIDALRLLLIEPTS